MSTWVVIAITSRYWYNYRHESNGYAIYQVVRSLGVEDDHIVFMDAADLVHNPRNRAKGEVHIGTSLFSSNAVNLIGEEGVDVDYRGESVTAELLRHVLLAPADAPSSSPTLQSTAESNVLIYMAGHGGDEFFKFHDTQELDAVALASMLDAMHQQRKYRQLLIVMDTCQAVTMGSYLQAPNVTLLASSRRGENSYSLHLNRDLGISTVDRFTHAVYQYLLKKGRSSSVQDLLRALRPSQLYSTPEAVQSPGTPPPSQLMLMDFFGQPSAASAGAVWVGGEGSSTSSGVQQAEGADLLSIMYSIPIYSQNRQQHYLMEDAHAAAHAVSHPCVCPPLALLLVLVALALMLNRRGMALRHSG